MYEFKFKPDAFIIEEEDYEWMADTLFEFLMNNRDAKKKDIKKLINIRKKYLYNKDN